jgi:hypothetical protein
LCLKKRKFNKQTPKNFPRGEIFFSCEKKKKAGKEERKEKEKGNKEGISDIFKYALSPFFGPSSISFHLSQRQTQSDVSVLFQDFFSLFNRYVRKRI